MGDKVSKCQVNVLSFEVVFHHLQSMLSYVALRLLWFSQVIFLCRFVSSCRLKCLSAHILPIMVIHVLYSYIEGLI
jgi:hypothetical protein